MSQFTEFSGKLVRSMPEDLPPEVMQEWISKPTGEVHRELWRFLARSLRSVFTTVKIGTYQSVESMIASLVHRYYVDEEIQGAMRQDDFTIADDVSTVDLVVVSPHDLGVDGRAEYPEIVDRAERLLGLELCPPEAAPQLRLQYPGHQPEDEYLTVAHEPIRGRVGGLYLCKVQYYYSKGPSLLASKYNSANSFYSSNSRFVFAR